jgi:hypothetical protein
MLGLGNKAMSGAVAISSVFVYEFHGALANLARTKLLNVPGSPGLFNALY